MKGLKSDIKKFKDGYFDETLKAGFIVSEDGKITGERLLSKPISTELDEKFLIILSESDWTKGLCEEKPVNSWVEYSLMVLMKE